MLNLMFGLFHLQLEQLVLFHGIAKKSAEKSPTDDANEHLIEGVKVLLEGLQKECPKFELEQSYNHAGRILEKIKKPVTNIYLQIQLEDLRAAIHAEGRNHSAFFVEPSKSKLLYVEPHPWDPIEQAFPSAGADIISAIKCYMYEENTASVFHSMRVLEVGLKALAEGLGLPFGSEVWKVVLDNIEAEIGSLEQKWPKGPTKTEFLQFYSTAAKEFRYFKDGWRNYVSHNLHEYDAPQALGALNHVRDFMLQLATRLSET